MNRRHFLQTTAALTAGALTHARAAQPAKPLRLAVNLNMAGAKDGPVGERFRMVKDAGFEGIELNRPDDTPLDELLRARDATGLVVAGVICSTHWGKPLTHPDPAVREQGLRGLRLALREAGELGCAHVLLVPGVVNAATGYADAYARSQAAIRAVLPEAETAGVKIAVENVWNDFLLSPLEAARFVDELASPRVGWHFDIGNVVAWGWPEQWIRTLGPRILNLHLKDYSRRKRDTEGMRRGFQVELGEGDVAWPEVRRALADIGYRGWAIAEVPGGDAARLQFLARRMGELLGG